MLQLHSAPSTISATNSFLHSSIHNWRFQYRIDNRHREVILSNARSRGYVHLSDFAQDRMVGNDFFLEEKMMALENKVTRIIKMLEKFLLLSHLHLFQEL